MGFNHLVLSTESVKSGVIIYWSGVGSLILNTTIRLDVPSNIHGKVTLEVLLEGRNTGIRKDSPAKFAGISRYHQFVTVMFERAIRAKMTMYFYHTPHLHHSDQGPLIAIHGDGRLELLEGHQDDFENLQELMTGEGLKFSL